MNKENRVDAILDVIANNLPKWRAWFPDDDSIVDVPRGDLLAVADEVVRLRRRDELRRMEIKDTDAALADVQRRCDRLAERERELVAVVLQVANRLADAAEVLGRVAERKAANLLVPSSRYRKPRTLHGMRVERLATAARWRECCRRMTA